MATLADLLEPEFEGVYEAPFLDAGFRDTLRAWGETAYAGTEDPDLEVRSALGTDGERLMWSDDAAPMWSGDSEPMWQSWEAWQGWTVGEITAQLVQHRIRIDPYTASAVTAFRPVADVPPRSESGRVSVPVEGVEVIFTKRFHAVPVVQATPVNGVAFADITDETKTGFTVRLYDSTNTAVAGQVNWTASTE